MPGAPPPGERDFGAYLGYVGPWSAPPTPAGKVTVIPESVSFSESGRWSAAGMVRNESTNNVTSVTVQATLQLFGTNADAIPVLTSVPVEPLRPGEPAPFDLSVDLPVEAVRAVAWTVSAVPAPAESSDRRRLKTQTFWERPFGDTARHEDYPLTDPAEPPYPYAIFGGLESQAQSALSDVAVWLAFVDDQERVRAVKHARMVGPNSPSLLKPGSTLDFLFVANDGSKGENLNGLRVALWGVSSCYEELCGSRRQPG